MLSLEGVAALAAALGAVTLAAAAVLILVYRQPARDVWTVWRDAMLFAGAIRPYVRVNADAPARP